MKTLKLFSDSRTERGLFENFLWWIWMGLSVTWSIVVSSWRAAAAAERVSAHVRSTSVTPMVHARDRLCAAILLLCYCSLFSGFLKSISVGG